ncbi:conjugative transposon protein TraM [Paraflavisolibacter sp. H34]|uniref:conjugative transposon protein TraM n=1 Tax=Huijunlia imazamoxiresistens TaxID=3127457 RepID=UPI0030182562
MEKKPAGRRPVDRKTIVVLGASVLVLILALSIFLSRAKGRDENLALNTNVPPPSKDKMHLYDSVSSNKALAYEEEKKKADNGAVPLNLDLGPLTTPAEEESPERRNPPREGARDSQYLEPTLKEQLKMSQEEFYRQNQNNGTGQQQEEEPPRREVPVYAPPPAPPQQQVEETKKPEGFTSVTFDGRGNPATKTVNGQTFVYSDAEKGAEDVKGNVLESTGGDVYADKQNIVGSIMRRQDVYSGSLVQIRLEEAIVVNGVNIPKNSVITGRARISNSRIEVVVPSVYVGGILYDIGFQLYDQDGVSGLYIPDAVSIRQVRAENFKASVKQGINQEVENGTRESTDGGKAGAISRTGRTLARMVTGGQKPLKINVPEGYKVLLRPYCESCKR